MNKQFDVIIIGGSYAGLSAAMTLGRSLKTVLVIDSKNPCNKQTPYSHNFIKQDGVPPAEIARKGKEQVMKYDTVHFIDDLATKGTKTGSGFTISTKSGKSYDSKKLIFATGIRDLMPHIVGFSDCWGISVIHCPYCHGYEFKGKKTGIMANGNVAFHVASLVNNLTNSLMILTNGKSEFTKEQIQKIDDHGIEINEKEIKEFVHQNGHLKNIIFNDGKKTEFDACYAAIPFEQYTKIPYSLGCEITEQGYIQVDDFQKTTIPGIYACGDNSSRLRSVSNAVATGNFAGSALNMEMTQESF